VVSTPASYFKVSDSNLGPEAGYPEGFVDFLGSAKQLLGCFKLGYDHFLI
jgi:hypothetical protein